MMRYLKIFIQYTKISLMSQMAYRPSFVLAVIGKLLYFFIMIFFFWAIYRQIPSIAGWSFDQMLLLVSVYKFIDFICQFSFYRNLFYYFSWWIYGGEFDIYLTRPINPLFVASFDNFDMMDLVSGIIAGGTFIYALIHLSIQISIWQILGFIIMILCALIIIYSICLLMSSTFFFTQTGRGLGDVVGEMIELSKYPIDIYKNKLKEFLIYIFPVIALSTLPTQILLGNADMNIVIYIILFSIAIFIIAYKTWFWALRHYSSASS